MTAYVLYEWLAVGVTHEVIAIGAVGAALLGIQLLIFGVLADMIFSLHREQVAQLERQFPHGAPAQPPAEATEEPVRDTVSDGGVDEKSENR